LYGDDVEVQDISGKYKAFGINTIIIIHGNISRNYKTVI
jgi:hypothetical protein